MVTAASFISSLRRYVGVLYVYGGKTAKGLDCSGLVTLALADVGITFPHGSANQIAATTPITVEEAWATPGALLYRDGHDAISLGDGTAIEAIRPKVSITQRTETINGQPRFTRAGIIPGIKYQENKMTRMSSPVEGRISSPYGYRTLAGKRSLHAGMDIAAPLGTTVRAVFAGTVVKVVSGRAHGQSAGTGTVLAPGRSGNGALVRNPDGEHQLYGHVDPRVKVGDKVSIGSALGEVDLSGNTTGPHVHLEVWGSSNPNSHRDPMIDFRHFGVTAGGKPATVAPSKPAPAPKPSVSNPSVLQRQKDLNRYANAGLIEDGISGPVMKRWDAWVKQLQQALPAWRDVPNILADSHYGTVTANAVKILQRNNGLVPDGVAGDITINYMRRNGSKVTNRPNNRP